VKDRAKLAEEKDVMARKKAIARQRSAGRGSLLSTSPTGQAANAGPALASNLGGV